MNGKVYEVRSGLLRSYTIDHKGKEHIFMFAPEGWMSVIPIPLFLKKDFKKAILQRLKNLMPIESVKVRYSLTLLLLFYERKLDLDELH
ncbi:hypothetical protein [Flammeovirga aprica]|uniref:hypothetical protein n=1 Tax=Flammeovirga aprica TaxID=29528 RepID=UPI00197DA6C1|nr:hypothetical protein [Flammeovirga aprica]